MKPQNPAAVTRAELRQMTPDEVLAVNIQNIVRDEPDHERAAARAKARAQLAQLAPDEILRMHAAGELDHILGKPVIKKENN